MDMTISADCVVRNEAGAVLLIRREDFRMWTVPGGAVERGETLPQAAIREVFEESGVEAVADELVGLYSGRRLSHLAFVYRGHAVGGTPRPSRESIDSRYFAPERLPRPMIPFARQRLYDALSGARGIYCRQPPPLWVKLFFPTMLRFRKIRNRFQGYPEMPPKRRPVQIEGLFSGNGSDVIEVEPELDRPIWETLRQTAELTTGRRVEVVHLLDADVSADPVVVRFALRYVGEG